MNKPTWNQRICQEGENLAAQYLEGQGIEILERNYRTDYGEIDLIGLDKEELVFFEIKTRTSTQFGLPELAITSRKLHRMMDCAESYVQRQSLNGNMRIDVIAILIKKNDPHPSIEWIRNVSEGN